ncbi:hypothetical protein D3C75_650440 [compost metagenome]
MGKFRPSGAHQSGNADDFALVHMEVNILHNLTAKLRIISGPVLHLKHRIAELLIASFGVNIIDVTAYHALDDHTLRNFIVGGI